MILFRHYFLILFIAKNDIDFFVGVQNFGQIHEHSENGISITGSKDYHIETVGLDRILMFKNIICVI
jgi:hypothetical protein